MSTPIDGMTLATLKALIEQVLFEKLPTHALKQEDTRPMTETNCSPGAGDPGRDVPDSYGAEEYQVRQAGRAVLQEQRQKLADKLDAAHADHVRFTLLAQQLATLSTISRMSAVSASAEYSILPEDMSQGMQAAVQGSLGANVLRKTAAGDEAIEAIKTAPAAFVTDAIMSLGLTAEAIAQIAASLAEKAKASPAAA